jgi:hypothetical protein
MNEMKPISNSRDNVYKVAIILLLAYAAYSSAVRDLNHLHEVAGEVHQFTSQGLGGLAKVYSATRSFAEGPQLARGTVIVASSEYPRNEIIDAGGSGELTGFDQESVPIITSDQKADRYSSVTPFREVRYLRADGSEKQSACELRRKEKEKEKAIEKNLNWSELAQAPTRVALLRRGFQNQKDIDVETLVQTGRFRTIIRKAQTKPADAHWPTVNEFKNFTGVIGMKLLPKSDEAEPDFEVGISDETSLPLLEKVKRGVVVTEDTDNAHKE